MNKNFFLIALIFISFIGFSQNTNIELVSRVNFQELHDTELNDVWGHVDAFGNEYALVGARKGTSIISLQDPENPVEIFWEPGMESIWRDIKTWKNFAYVTTEAQNGLLIIDMNTLPNPNGVLATYYTGPQGANWFSAHNLYIDSNGYAYIFGANRGNGGVIILDVNTNPLSPIEVGVFDEWYVHDGYVVNDTLFLAHINEGFISVVDVTDKSSPILLGTKNTHSNFSHNIWTTPNGDYGFTTDEVSGAFLGSYDLRNPENIIELDLVQSSPGKGVIPHNVHVKGDFLVTSYYSDGVTIHDISRPHNLIEIGNYDTYPNQTTGYDGCWGAYPFLPSGLILASDISEGLFILNPNYVNASFLEGHTYNQETNEALDDVKIEISNEIHTEFSKIDGFYATGTKNSGLVNVTYSKVGFFPQTVSVNLIHGEVLEKDIYLTPMNQFSLKVIVLEQNTNQAILNANVQLTSSLTQDLAISNGLGESNFNLFYSDNYEIIAGKWGYKNFCNSIEINENTNILTVYLEPGYYDDFTFDFNWTSNVNGATHGLWERGKPNGTSSNSAPSFDAQFDCGDKAYITGNNASLDPNEDEIKNGEVVLLSPIFDLSNFDTPFIHYSRWYYNLFGPNPPPDDTLKIYLNNGFSTVLIDQQWFEEGFLSRWIDKSVKVRDFILPTNNMRLILKISDLEPNGNITEAGLDFFYVDEFSHLNFVENSNPELKISPNLCDEYLEILSEKPFDEVIFIDMQGKEVMRKMVITNNIKIDVRHLNQGVYFVKLKQKDRIVTRKIVKM